MALEDNDHARSLRVDILSIFPEMFKALTASGITARAVDQGLADLHFWNPRDFVLSNYKSVDDRPYGGGPGMVMMAPPLRDCWKHAQERGAKGPFIYLSPQGRPLTQARVEELSQTSQFTLLCGRYEGVDERFLRRYADEEICVGDFVVSGGELPAMMLLDAVIRRLPGALNHELSAVQDSFMQDRLDYPHYTRPETFEGESVPEILLSGHHEKIQKWREEQAFRATQLKRPDLLEKTMKASQKSS